MGWLALIGCALALALGAGLVAHTRSAESNVSNPPQWGALVMVGDRDPGRNGCNMQQDSRSARALN